MFAVESPLLWANGDRSVYDQIKLLRDEVKLCKRELVEISRMHQETDREIDEVVTEDQEQNNPDYQKRSAELDGARRVEGVCGGALTLISETRRHIRNTSTPVNPKGKSARAAVDRKAGDLSVQVKKVYSKVLEVNKMARLYGSVSARIVEKLNITFSGLPASHGLRRKELNTAVRNLGEVRGKITAIHRKSRRRAKTLEKELAELVKARRNRFLR